MQTQEQKRKENSLKSTYFNRYLMLRYSLAAMFFGICTGCLSSSLTGLYM